MVKVAADTYEHLGHQTRASEVIALALAATTTTGVSVMLQMDGKCSDKQWMLLICRALV